MRALLDLLDAIRGTVTVALRRAHPMALLAWGSVAVVVALIGVWIAVDDPGGGPGGRDTERAAPADDAAGTGGSGQGEGRADGSPLVPGLNQSSASSPGVTAEGPAAEAERRAADGEASGGTGSDPVGASGEGSSSPPPDQPAEGTPGSGSGGEPGATPAPTSPGATTPTTATPVATTTPTTAPTATTTPAGTGDKADHPDLVGGLLGLLGLG